MKKKPKIFNGTSHKITFFKAEDAQQHGRKLVLINPGTIPLKEIEPGIDLNCTTENLPDSDEWDTDIPISGALVFTAVDELPPGYDIYIVSNLYRSAYKELNGDTSKLATIKGSVYLSIDDTRPVGCLGLIKG